MSKPDPQLKAAAEAIFRVSAQEKSDAMTQYRAEQRAVAERVARDEVERDLAKAGSYHHRVCTQTEP
jgi:hypothetical protein